jgi:hypothetical protein
MTATAICLAETYDRAVSKYRVSTFGDLREDRAARSLLTRPVCEVPPPPLPPSKKRFFPAAGGMRSHSADDPALRTEQPGRGWQSVALEPLVNLTMGRQQVPEIAARPCRPREHMVDVQGVPAEGSVSPGTM